MKNPFLFVVAGFSAGIVLGACVHLKGLPAGILGCVTFFMVLLVFKFPRYERIGWSMAFILAGMLHMNSHWVLAKDNITFMRRHHPGQVFVLEGKIVSDIKRQVFFRAKRLSFTLQVERSGVGGDRHLSRGKILVNLFQDLPLSYGDIILVEGKLHKPFNFSKNENFSYVRYLEQRGIYEVLSAGKNSRVEVLAHGRGVWLLAKLYQWRKAFKSILSQRLTPNEAGFLQAVLLGDRSFIPKHLREAFTQTGTVHILAISGLHVGFVAGIFMALLKAIPIGRRWQMSVVIGLLVMYCLLTGATPSVVRATVMSIIFLCGLLWEREAQVLNSLCFAAFMILAWNPYYLFDVGFQLSFSCVLSLVFFSPKISEEFLRCLPSRGPARGLKNSLSASLSIWLGVSGLVAYYFNIVTPITIIANLVIIPLNFILVVLGFGVLLSEPMGASLQGQFTVLIKVVFNVMLGAVYLLRGLPGAYVFFREVSVSAVSVYYLILIISFSVPYRKLYNSFITNRPGVISQIRSWIVRFRGPWWDRRFGA